MIRAMECQIVGLTVQDLVAAGDSQVNPSKLSYRSLISCTLTLLISAIR